MSQQHTLHRTPRRYSVGDYAGTPVASQVSTWVQNVINNGGAAPSTGTILALNDFWNGLVTDALSPFIITANCFVPDSLTAALTPLVVQGNNPWTNTNFVSGDLSINGLTGNGSNKTLDTGFNPFTTAGTLGQSAYAAKANGSVNGFEMGNQDASNILGLQADDAGSAVSINGNGAQGIVTSSPGPGFYSDNRHSLNNRRLYYAKSTTAYAQIGATDANTFTSYPNFTCWVFALNDQGSANVVTNDTISFAAYHFPFSVAQGTKFFARVQSMRIALGGGYA